MPCTAEVRPSRFARWRSLAPQDEGGRGLRNGCRGRKARPVATTEGPVTSFLILRCEPAAMRQHRPEASLEGRTCPDAGLSPAARRGWQAPVQPAAAAHRAARSGGSAPRSSAASPWSADRRRSARPRRGEGPCGRSPRPRRSAPAGRRRARGSPGHGARRADGRRPTAAPAPPAAAAARGRGRGRDWRGPRARPGRSSRRRCRASGPPAGGPSGHRWRPAR